MAPDVESLEHITEAPIHISPGEIEPELDRIWRDAANAGLGESSIRLRVLNFVAIAFSEGARARYDAVMEHLPQSHPCRALLALMVPDGGDVTAEISARCWLTGGRERHVCSEEVVLRAGEDRTRSLASAVLALVVRELPVAVWLVDANDLQHPLVREIAAAADEVFVDTGAAGDVTSTLDAVCAAERQEEFDVRDLAWERLVHVRSLVAQFFDGGDRLVELTRLCSIAIVSGGGRASSEALLLAGWLVSRLDLALADLDVGEAAVEATLYQGTRGVDLRVTAKQDSALAVDEMRIETENATFRIQQQREGAHLLVREEWNDGTEIERMVERGPTDDASLITQALDHGSDSEIFLEAVEAARVFAG